LYFEALGLNLYYHSFEGEGEPIGKQRHRLLALRRAGLQRKLARDLEARRPPTGKDFG
jgi:hypothetical protein